MFTASHNPAKYNGMKLCKSGARPIGQDTGLLNIRELIEKVFQFQIGQLAPLEKKIY